MYSNNKELVKNDFLSMIYNSWTWQRLTDTERQRFLKVFEMSKPIGNYKARWEQLNILYHAFLMGTDYQPLNWRESEQDAPSF